MRTRAVAALPLLVLVAVAAEAASAEDRALSLSDLAAYRTALIDRDGSAPPPAPAVTFRDLWSHPERFGGRRVEVRGRVVRRFRQQAFGTFPPLVEAWAVDRQGEPFCLVYPAPRTDLPPARTEVRFVGTFLRRIRYQSGDVPRLAPLIVGPRAPLATDGLSAEAPFPAAPRSSWVEWGLAGALGGVVLLALLRQSSRRPRARTAPSPPPTFVAGADESPPTGGAQDDSQAVRFRE